MANFGFDPTVVLDGVAAPDPVRGYIGNTAVASWVRKATSDQPVSVAEHNAMVAYLAWMLDLSSRRPSATGLFAHSLEGDAMVLGLVGKSFEGGDVTLRSASAGAYRSPGVSPTNPAGAAATTPVVSDYETISESARREVWESSRASLYGMRFSSGSFLAPVPTSNPAGAWPILAIGVVVVAGIAAYAAYSSYVGGQRIQAEAQVRSVRIQEEGLNARTVAVNAATSQDFTASLAYAAQHGVFPPLPQRNVPIPTPAQIGQQEDWRRGIAKDITTGLVYTGLGAAAVVGGAVIVDRALARRSAAKLLEGL